MLSLMTTLQLGQNAPVPTSALSAVVRWTPGAVGVDLSALLLTSTGKVRSDADFVFYNQPRHGSGAVEHQGSTGGTGSDAVRIDLAAREVVRAGLRLLVGIAQHGSIGGADVDRIAVVASADGGTFAQVQGLTVDIVDAGGATLLDAPLQGDTETAFLTGEFYRRGGDWKFRAVGQGWAAGLAGLARDFGISVDDDESATPPATSTASAPPAPAAAPPAANPPAAAPPAPAISLKKQKLVDMEKKVGAQAPALLSLTKKAAVSLEKRGLGEHTAKVALCLDISGSMYRLYKTGQVQQLAERVLALALRFDDDGEVDVFLFGAKAYQDAPMTLDNHQTYVDDMLKLHKLEAGTRYGRAMELLRQHYLGDASVRSTPAPQQVPVYVMFVTDGATTDQDLTREQLTSSSYEPMFWQFMAIGASGSPAFAFLEKLDDLAGRYLDNADFFAVENPATISDDALFELLMTEYPAWLKQARAQGLLPAG